MNTRPIVPATLAHTEDGVPYSAHYGDVYHPRAGAFTQAQHVFLAGNGLPGRWARRERFVVLETGFGLGNNFLATWQAWRDDPMRCERLVFISVEQSPFSAGDMKQAHAASPAPKLAQQLIGAWPPLTHNLHTLEFEGGRVRLLLALGDAQAWLPELVAQVDAFYLDGFAPARNPQMWEPRLFKALARLAAPEATLATWSAASAVRDGLRTAGFEVCKAAGTGGKRDITLARYAPRYTPRGAPARMSAPSEHHHALIVGAGLAGCATAHALAAEGWNCTVYERHAGVAQETSGNLAGLFHGTVHAQDGVHARMLRAAALMAQRSIASAVQGGVRGAVQGLLRLDTASVEELAAVIATLGLPPDYVQAADATQASRLCGLPLRRAAWFYPGGGWVQPNALCKAWLEDAAPRATLRTGIEVHRLQQTAGGWQLLDINGAVIDEAPTVVLANAADAVRLLGRDDWPLTPVRGQVSQLARAHAPQMPLPAIPVAGAGYLLPDVAGEIVFGATSQPDDLDPTVREADHMANLAQLGELLGSDVMPGLAQLHGRVGWRVTSRDRLPVVGGVPLATPGNVRLDQPRFVPRLPGLHVCTALASRGITWAPLAATTLAGWIAGAPMPLEASLLDAIDPARYTSRAARRVGAPP